MDLGDAAPERGGALHLGDVVEEEEHLPVGRAGDHRELVAGVLHDEARVLDALLAAELLRVDLPALAVGRVGEHEVELGAREAVGRERRAEGDVGGLGAVALEEHVGLGDGVGLGVDLLAEEVDRDGAAGLAGEGLEARLGDREHAARAAGGVVAGVGARQDAVADGDEDQVGHQLHHVARREVLAGLLVVLLVEAADQLLENRAHRVVVEVREADGAVVREDGAGREVDRGRDELLDDGAEDAGLVHRGELLAELELLEDLLDVGREAVEVGLEVGEEALGRGAGDEVAQDEGRIVAERLAGGLAEGGGLVGDAGRVEPRLEVEHGLLGGLEHRVEAADDRHREDDVAVLAADVDVAEAVVGDAPDEGDERGNLRGGHGVRIEGKGLRSVRRRTRRACRGLYTSAPRETRR